MNSAIKKLIGSIFLLGFSAMTPDEIKRFRKSKGLSQEELGKLCGVGKSAVSLWESGGNVPAGSAKVLLEEFMGGTRCIVPLTQAEEQLLDRNVHEGNFVSREDFLAASLVHLLRHGGFDVPTKTREVAPLEVLKVAEDSERMEPVERQEVRYPKGRRGGK
jgi:transcriptional regulator with XRE-family HTH domain